MSIQAVTYEQRETDYSISSIHETTQNQFKSNYYYLCIKTVQIHILELLQPGLDTLNRQGNYSNGEICLEKTHLIYGLALKTEELRYERDLLLPNK